MEVLRILLLTVVLGVTMGRPDCCGSYPRPRICKRLRANCPQKPSVHVCCRSDIPRPKMCSYVRVACPQIEPLPLPGPAPIHVCCRTDIPLPAICASTSVICPPRPPAPFPKPVPIQDCCRTDIPLPGFCASAIVNCSHNLPFPKPDPISVCCRTDIPLPEFCARAFDNCSKKTYRPSRRGKRQSSIGGNIGNRGRSGSINFSHQSRKWGKFGASGNFARGSKPSWGLSWSKKFRK